MKLKKRQFARLKDISEEINTSGMFGLGGVKLDKLIADIESVQKVKEEFSLIDIDQLQKDLKKEKVKTIKEKPLSTTGFVGNVEFSGNIFNDSIRQEFSKSYIRQGESMVAASTDETTIFKGGLRDAVEALAEPKIGDVGFFWGEPLTFVYYGRLIDIITKNGVEYATSTGTYSNFSKTPPELK